VTAPPDGPPAPPGDPSGQAPRAPEPRAARAATRRDVRAALALAGPVLFTPPALALADRDATVLGVPTLVVYVLVAWLLGILLTFLAAREPREGRR